MKAVHKLRSDPYKMGVRRILRTNQSCARQDEDIHCYNCNKCRHYARDCLLPKRTSKEQRSGRFEDEVKSIFWKVIQKNNWKPKDFEAKEKKEEGSVSSSIDGVHSENHMLSNVRSLQHRVNNLSVEERKASYAQFKVKQRNLLGLALIDTGNLLHSSIVSGEFWEAIGGKISNSMDYNVGTADGQSEGLQVLVLEGMEECYVLEPLVIQGLIHSVKYHS